MENRTPRRRYRSSTSASNSPAPKTQSGAINNLLERLSQHNEPNLNTLSRAYDDLKRLGILLGSHEAEGGIQDQFRRARGFQTILQVLRLAAKADAAPNATSGLLSIQICTEILNILLQALKDHYGNRRYFARRVKGGGWHVLCEELQVAVSHGSQTLTTEELNRRALKLIGALVALALGDTAYAVAVEAFQFTSPQRRGIEEIGSSPSGNAPPEEIPSEKSIKSPGETIVQEVFDFAKSCFTGGEQILNNEAVTILTSLYKHVSLQDTEGVTLNPVALLLLALIEGLANFSQHNKVAVHDSGALSALLPCLTRQDVPVPEVTLLQRLCGSLLSLGTHSLDEAAQLFRQAAANDGPKLMLLNALKESKEASAIQFDLSQSGHCSIELPCLPRAFPPISGYSFTAWVRIDKFDAENHTTLFGAFDASQTCFVLVYIEKDTRQLILQTSVTSAKPSVRFKKARFREAEWCHIAIVQRPSKVAGTGQAALFINGRFLEELQCTYPEAPPLSPEPRDVSNPSQMNTTRRRTVQAFFGTPQDLASQSSERMTKSLWSLANAHLYETCLPMETITVHHKLGPRYCGNFQDCIGPFLTYRASAELNRYNESILAEKADKSEIVQATQQRGVDLLPESKLLISVSAESVANMNGVLANRLNIMDMLTDKATQYFQSLTRNGNSIIFNAARPAINEAMVKSYGVAVVTGNPTLRLSQSLDDASWQIGGCLPISMRILQNSFSDDDIVIAVEILFQCIGDNWRTSEAMEKENGFGVLAILLREKLGLTNNPAYGALARFGGVNRTVQQRDALAMRLLNLILRFVGYDSVHPERSILINPMAYRILLVDFDTWRTVSIDTQKLYFQQMADFVWKNKSQAFNIKRFNKMRVVRRTLDALKADRVTPEVLPEILHTLKSLCVCKNSHLNHRDIATFITYALQDERAMQSATPLLGKGMRQGSMAGQFAASPRIKVPNSPRFAEDSAGSRPLTQAEIGISVLETYAEVLCAWDNNAHIKKFDHQVPTKWLLHLASETNPRAVSSSLAIISQALVEAPSFRYKFAEKNAGFMILQNRLRSHWQSPSVWIGCFAILFGRPCVSQHGVSELTLFHLMELFVQHGEIGIQTPEIFPSIAAMLEAGIRSVVNDREPSVDTNANYGEIAKTVIQFLADVHARSLSFRDFAINSQYVQELLFVLFPVIASADRLNASAELASDTPLSFQGRDVVLRPHSNSVGERPTVLRSGSSRTLPEQTRLKPVQAPRRTSSFVFVNQIEVTSPPTPARFNAIMSPSKTTDIKIRVGNSVVESLLEMILAVFLDQLCQRKDFAGFGLFLKVPPGFQEHQAYFESYVLLHTMYQLWNHLQLDQKLLIEPRVLTNLARYSLHMAEAVFEGWFIDGAQPLLDFTGKVLEYLQQPNIASIKAVRLCTPAVTTLRSVFLRVTLLRLSELEEAEDDADSLTFLKKMNYWQTILFSPENQELPFIRLICYLLYTKLTSSSTPVRLAAASLWRILLVQKPTEAATILIQNTETSQRHLSTGLIKLAAHDDEELLQWIDQHRKALDDFFRSLLAVHWEQFVNSENQKTEESARNRLAKRKERLKQWTVDEAELENVTHRFDSSTRHWRSNIHSQERLKYQGTIQDQQENLSHLQTVIARIDNVLRQPCGLFADRGPAKWQLDQTESRNRMRMRIIPDTRRNQEIYQSKRKASEKLLQNRLHVDTKVSRLVLDNTMSPSPMTATDKPLQDDPVQTPQTRLRSDSAGNSTLLDGEFEMVDDPKDDEEGFEDKNRKVLKSLQRGDRVQNICNVSRIVGLEAFEGLLIIGKHCLYLQDDMFQRSDGEIVSVSQAPAEERDPYVQMISGKEIKSLNTHQRQQREPARHWNWRNLLSISKRRFLFRDVALEIFFTDGRSYLLTFMTPKIRDDVYSNLASKAPHVHGSLSSLPAEDAWRLDSLRNPEETPQTFGSKFANVFNSASSNAATRRWIRGEISNFQYLMLVNTMAGRTFNDLTQYPVFPWVLADYTSDELDLTSPRTFRDFSKPMGCQNPAREAEFRDRFDAFAEMGDQNSPAFHYGTHYSSAMIVSSYLIRLPPFVQSYLLLQGGTFDHADRLFDSIEKAWLSASRDNMTDVRELTPEFFYLPEFLTNINGYDFGQKQGSSQSINHVGLPPWAKGDPHIFIAKHREALESPYVSQHLQEWIDLIFGYKQRGEAALEATNVFHHLSYQGAKDLDAMEDSIERLATIGIIHNFGQTPYQIFQRVHPRKEDEKQRLARLDTIAESLIKLPFPLHESSERAVALTYSTSQDRLVCSPPCRLSVPPACKSYVQWGFVDNSLRFFSADSKKLLGLFEALHIGPISTALFADSKTLITGGADSTIGVWTISATSDAIDISSRTYLFGHRMPISVLAASRAFSTLVSASVDGHVLLWDLNRFDCVRVLQAANGGKELVSCAKVSNLSGHIALCSGSHVRMLTLNGHLLVEQKVCESDEDEVTCCAFYEGAANEWVERTLLLTGHKRGVVNIWSLVTLRDGAWHLQLVKRLMHVEHSRENAELHIPAITSVLAMSQAVYTGDEEGKVHEWNCVQRQSGGFGGWR